MGCAGAWTAAFVLGCSAPAPVRSAASAIDPPAESAPTTTSAAAYSVMESIATTCECMVARVEAYEVAVLADADGKPAAKPAEGLELASCAGGAATTAAPQPAVVLAMDATITKTSGELFAMLRKDKVSASIDVSPRATASLKSEAYVRGKLAGRHMDASRAAKELHGRVAALGATFRAAQVMSQTCGTWTLSAATQIEVGSRHGGSGFDPAKERVTSRRALAAAARADALAASTVALLAMHQAVARGGEPALADETMHGIARALPTEGHVSDPDVAALWANAKRHADAFDAAHKTWGDEERAHLRAMGREPIALVPPRLDGGAADRDDAHADAKAKDEALIALCKSDPSGTTKGAPLLFPNGAPMRHGLAGAAALVKGDFKGAAHAASAMVPGESKMGASLAGAARAIDAVPDAHETRGKR